MQFSWILFVKQIFNDCGFSDLWETEHFNNIEYASGYTEVLQGGTISMSTGRHVDN
jgi:hypothetical protein